jgi:hypothetical protein
MPVPMAVPELRADAPPEGAPDLIEPIVGWRVWDVVESEEGLLLSSLCFRATWPPRRAMLASCRRSSLNIGRVRLAGHEAPHARCSCGIYAVESSDRALPYLSRLFRGGPRTVHRVVGPVALWGTAVECTRGWRCSHAYPHALYVPTGRLSLRGLVHGVWRPSRSVEEIAFELTHYGVPIEIIDGGTARELAPHLREREEA